MRNKNLETRQYGQTQGEQNEAGKFVEVFFCPISPSLCVHYRVYLQQGHAWCGEFTAVYYAA